MRLNEAHESHTERDFLFLFSVLRVFLFFSSFVIALSFVKHKAKYLKRNIRFPNDVIIFQTKSLPILLKFKFRQISD